MQRGGVYAMCFEELSKSGNAIAIGPDGTLIYTGMSMNILVSASGFCTSLALTLPAAPLQGS